MHLPAVPDAVVRAERFVAVTSTNAARILERLERLAEQRPLTEAEKAYLQAYRQQYRERTDYFQGLMAAGVRFAAGSDAGWGLFTLGTFYLEMEALVDRKAGGPTGRVRLLSSFAVEGSASDRDEA